MKLLYLDFLWALFAVLIPIIIHLFNFKKFKKEYFSNVALLKEVKLETQNKSKLKHLLILATRIVAIILLVLAFCQPYFPVNNMKKMTDKVIAIYLDNSQSMDVKSDEGYLFDLAKSSARSIAKSYAASDNFILLTNDFKVNHQRIVSREEVIELIDEVKISSTARNINEIQEREKDLIHDFKGNKLAYWLSDFQVNSFDFASIEKDTTITTQLIPFHQKEKANIYIDSVWFDSPLRQANIEEKLFIRIVNLSQNEVTTKVNLKINDKIKGLINETISENTSKTVSINYSIQNKGVQLGAVYLSDYPEPDLVFDDTFYFSYQIEQKTPILYLSDKKNQDTTKGILAVYNNTENYNVSVENFSSVDYSSLNNYSLLILDGISTISSGLKNELDNYLNSGGNVLLTPSKNIDLNSYQTFFASIVKANFNSIRNSKTKVKRINKAHYIFNNVFNQIPRNIDLPFVNAFYPVSYRTQSRTENILTLENDIPYLTVSKINKGAFYFIASPLSESSFHQHALFVPILLKIAENSQFISPLEYTIGANELIELPQNNYFAGDLQIKSNTSDLAFIPEVIKTKTTTSLDLHHNISIANHYLLLHQNKLLKPLAYNYSRMESETTFYTEEELLKEIEKLGLANNFSIRNNAQSFNENGLTNILKEKTYWKLFIIGALFFLLLETLIIRLFKMN